MRLLIESGVSFFLDLLSGEFHKESNGWLSCFPPKDLRPREKPPALTRQHWQSSGRRESNMELIILLVVLVVAGSLIPANHHVVFYR
jgi:hypothetical protein